MAPHGLEELIDRIQAEQGITYAPQQRQAVELAATSQVMLLTGGPGTGKTTSLRGVLALFDALGLETALAAPTGRAAKRLSCAARRGPRSTAFWRPSTTPTPAGWCLPTMKATR